MFSLYLTGAPATGKSTVARAVAERTGGRYISYGELLTSQLQGRIDSQQELRAQSSAVISHADVLSADKEVQRIIAAASKEMTLIVDSHAVTRERYGFRAVPYGLAQWRELPFSHVVCLWAEREVVRARIKEKPEGRPTLTDEEFDMHAQLQSSLAITYAHTGGLPIAFVNSGAPLESVVSDVLSFAESG